MRDGIIDFGIRILELGLRRLPICDPRSAARLSLPTSFRERQLVIAQQGRVALAVVLLCGCALAGKAVAQDGEMMPGLDPTAVGATAPPMSQYSEGSFFSQELGTILRFQYRTESYGQNDHGNLDIGTMQVMNFDDSIAFFDGQVTLNDIQGVGFNLGVGYRWMHYAPYALEGVRMSGWSLWVDGTSTRVDNFFPQIGLSFESLGDVWDFRANGYIPLGDQDQVGDFVPTGEIGFQGNFISELTEAVVDSSFYVGELELARRLGAERDAWAFAGPYFLANSDQDAVGYRVGVRGYAFPDLLLQFAVSDDEIFATNATFSLVWFVGRTRTDFQPACGLPDRFREPVLRNDYVALDQSLVTGGIPLTNPSGDVIRVVHVNSNAPGGGSGTFENPFNDLGDVEGNSEMGDIVLAHAESIFTGQSIVLQDSQRFLGEGNDMTFTVTTEEEGVIPIPETSPGARALTRPQINAAIGDAITLADANEVANFDIDGMDVTVQAIASRALGAGNPNLHDMEISNTTGDGIELTVYEFIDVDDLDGDGNITEKVVRGNVTINNITFNSIGDGIDDAVDDQDDDIDINRFTSFDVTEANLTLQETITISNVTSNNGDGRGLFLEQTHAGRTATITNYTNTDANTSDGRMRFDDISGNVTITTAEIMGGTGYALDFFNVSTDSAVVISGLDYDGLAGAAGGIRADTYDGTMSVATSTFMNGTLEGVSLLSNSDGTFTFADTTMFDSIDGTTFYIDGDDAGADTFTGSLTVNSEITNDTGFSVDVRNIGAAGTLVAFLGDITDNGGLGISTAGNSNGTIRFGGDVTLATGADTAVSLTNNTGSTTNFEGLLDITTTSGDAFVATGGGTLSATGTTNKASAGTGSAVTITDMTIGSGGVVFDDVNRSGAAATQAILLQSNTGGAIILGTPGETDNGALQGGGADTVVIDNSANATLSGLTINNAAGFSGVRVRKTTTGTQTVNLNDLTINDGDIGVEVLGGGLTAGALNMSINDTDILTSTQTGLSIDNVDVGTSQINNVTIDGNGTAATAGVSITGSNASFTFDTDTQIQEVGGVSFDIDGGTGSVTYGGDITNTAGRSVRVQNKTGGVVNFNAASTITDTGEGLLVTNNTGGLLNFLGTNDFDTTTFDAVTLTNNTGATMAFGGLNINSTGTGQGFVATGGGTLSVTGPNNIIETDDGMGLHLEDMTIGAADFQRVTVNDGSGGPTNAIVLRNLTGGQVAIGTSAGAANSGGVLRSTGDAIVIENAQNVDLRHIQIVDAGGVGLNIDHTAAATSTMDVTIDALDVVSVTGNAIDVLSAETNSTFNLRLLDSTINDAPVVMSATTSSAFNVLLEGNTITTSGTDVAFTLNYSAAARNGDVTIRDGNNFDADDASAFDLLISGTNADIDFLLDGNIFSNSSNAAGSQTANFRVSGGADLDATITNNTFTASGSSDEFAMESDGSTSRINLDLDNNTSGGVYELTTSNNGGGFNFGVVGRANVNGNNVGTVNFNPLITDFEDILGPVQQPIVP